MAIIVVYVIFLIITPITNNGFYHISAENTYSRGKFFNVTIGCEALLYIEAILLIFKYHKNVKNFENIGFASFIFVPFICQIIQIANYGIALNSVGLSISFFIIYLNLNHKLQQEYDTAISEYQKIHSKLLKQNHKDTTAQDNPEQDI